MDVIDIDKDISRTPKPQAERDGKAFLKELTKNKCWSGAEIDHHSVLTPGCLQNEVCSPTETAPTETG